MNFLACDGDWLQGEAIVLFATVFGFLVLKKALKQ